MRRTQPVSATALCLAISLTIGAPEVCRGAPPVEGDAALLKTLVDAQATNLALFPKGEMTAEVSERLSRLDATATVIWDGDKTYTRYRVKQTVKEPVVGKPGELIDVDKIQSGEMIERPGVLLVHFPSLFQARAYVDHIAGTGYIRELQLRPEQIWFRYEGIVDVKEIIDPSVARGDGFHFVVKREGADQVVVDRCVDKTGDILRFTASLAAGANITSYDKILAKGSKECWSKGTYSWDHDSKGRWYLRELHYLESAPGDPANPYRDTTIRVTAFNAEPAIPENRFEFSSFKFEEGTVVEEGLILGRSSAKTPGRRTYRVEKQGRAESKLDDSRLNDLADKLRGTGFAAAGRISN